MGQSKIYKDIKIKINMEMIKISKEEYDKLKMQANIDLDLLKQFVRSLKDIKEGRIIRVK